MSQQPQTTTLSELKKPVPPLDPSIKAGFDTVGGFDLIQRTAKLFAASNIVPQQFQGNLPNCVIAVDMALRMGANPLMVCQNLYIVHGRPAWSAQIPDRHPQSMRSGLRPSATNFRARKARMNGDVAPWLPNSLRGEKLTGPLITIGLCQKGRMVRQEREQVAVHAGTDAPLPGGVVVRPGLCPGDRHGLEDRRRSAGHV